MKFSFEGTPEELVALVTQLVAGGVAGGAVRGGVDGGAGPSPREPVRYAPEGEPHYVRVRPVSMPVPPAPLWGSTFEGDGYQPPGAPEMGRGLHSTTLQGGVPVGVSFPGTPGAQPEPFSAFVDAFGEAASHVEGWQGYADPTPLKHLIAELADRRWAREREAWLGLLYPWLGIMDQPAIEVGVSPAERVRLSGRLRDRLTKAFEEKGPALMQLVRLASERGAGITTLFRALLALGGAYPLMREMAPFSAGPMNGAHEHDLAMTRLLAEHFVAVASACQMGNLFRLERISDAASYVVPRSLEATVRATWRERARRFDPDFAAIEHHFRPPDAEPPDAEPPGGDLPGDLSGDLPQDDEPNPNPDDLTF